MTDRELLELAAKGAGYRVEYGREDGEVHVKTWDHGNYSRWNPIEDDGDAFRLMIKIRITVDFRPDTDSVICWLPEQGGATVGALGDIELRRAIVRAAAEIGKAMQAGN